MEESFYKTFRKTFVNQYKQKANLEHKEVKNNNALFTPPDDPFAVIPQVPDPIIQKQPNQNIVKAEEKKEEANLNAVTPNSQHPNQINQEPKVVIPAFLMNAKKVIHILCLVELIFITWLAAYSPTVCINKIGYAFSKKISKLYMVYFIPTMLYIAAVVFMMSDFATIKVIIAIGMGSVNILWHMIMLIAYFTMPLKNTYPKSNIGWYSVDLLPNFVMLIVCVIFLSKNSVIRKIKTPQKQIKPPTVIEVVDDTKEELDEYAQLISSEYEYEEEDENNENNDNKIVKENENEQSEDQNEGSITKKSVQEEDL